MVLILDRAPVPNVGQPHPIVLLLFPQNNRLPIVFRIHTDVYTTHLCLNLQDVDVQEHLLNAKQLPIDLGGLLVKRPDRNRDPSP